MCYEGIQFFTQKIHAAVVTGTMQKRIDRESCSTTSQHAKGWAKCLWSQNDTGKAGKYKLAALESIYCSGSTGQAGIMIMTFLHSQLADEKGTWQSTGNHHPCQDFVMWLQVLESLNHSSSKQSKGPTVSYSPSLQYMLHILSHAVLDNNIEEIIGQICFLQELCARSIFLLALAKAL